MDQVVALGVAPVHVSPPVAIGIVLVEKVILPLVLDGAIRVVYPQGRRAEVTEGPRRIGLGAFGSLGNAFHGTDDVGVIRRLSLKGTSRPRTTHQHTESYAGDGGEKSDLLPRMAQRKLTHRHLLQPRFA